MLVKYASRCDVLVYEHLTDPEVATPCGERSSEYTEWPTCRNCHDHVCLNHRMQDTFEDDEGRETVLCRDCYWQTVKEKDRRAGAKLAASGSQKWVFCSHERCTLRAGHAGAHFSDECQSLTGCILRHGHSGDHALPAEIAAAKAGSKPAGRCGNYAGHEICSDPLGCSKPSGHEGNCGWDL